MLKSVDEAPLELAVSIREFWSPSEWDNAASIAFLESAWNTFAVDDTRDGAHPCGAELAVIDGTVTTAELSVGYFQINACNFPTWEWQRFYNARHNAGTAHLLFDRAGGNWSPWFFSALELGLL